MTGQPWVDAPVFIDATTGDGGVSFVRVSYLTIECEDPAWGWSLTIRGGRLPIALLGLAAVVLQPLGGTRFRRPAQFDEFIRGVESHNELSVEVGDLYLPRFLFNTPQAGDVYRVRARLFGVAYQYRHGRSDLRDFTGMAEELRQEISFSVEETKAYHLWHAQVAREEPIAKNSELRLRNRGPL
ncbi:MAG: hypothetical protein AB7J63_01045 [Vicinamibacterales bacterium]